MVTMELDNFSLEQICDSGQCFRMKKIGEHTYSLVAGDQYLEITQKGTIVDFHCSDVELICFWVPYFDLDTDYSEYIQKVNPRDRYLSAAAEMGSGIRIHCSDVELICFWVPYFDLDTDYSEYIQKVNPRDRYLSAAAEMGSGIRILRQDLWEMIITFLISQQNHITRIRGCIERLCACYGDKKVSREGVEYYSFPGPEALALATETELRELGMGYRARYLVETARSIAEGEVSLEKIFQMRYYSRAKKELMSLVVWEKRLQTVSVCLPCIIWMLFLWTLISVRFWRSIIKGDFQTGDIMA